MSTEPCGPDLSAQFEPIRLDRRWVVLGAWLRSPDPWSVRRAVVLVGPSVKTASVTKAAAASSRAVRGPVDAVDANEGNLVAPRKRQDSGPSPDELLNRGNF